MRSKLFHKLPVILLLLIVPFTLYAADGGLTLSQGDYDSVSLYDPYGARLDATATITNDGYIIRTGSSTAIFSSPFGDIEAEANTLIAVTGAQSDNLSLYLLDGEASIDLVEGVSLTLYTTTAAYKAEGKGEYHFIYTADEDKAFNISGAELSVSDPLRALSHTLGKGDSIDMLSSAISRAADRLLSEGSISFMGAKITYALYPVKVVITYPEWITESEVSGFFAYLASAEPALLEGVTYSFTGNGEVTVDYGTELELETQKALIEKLSAYLSPYAASLLAAMQSEVVNVAGTIEYAGYSLEYNLGAESGTITYPDVVTNADVEAFFAYLASENPALLEGVTYSFTGADEVTVDYGTELDAATLEYLVKVFEENLVRYISLLFPAPRIPAAPSFKGVKVELPALLTGTISYAGYSINYSLGVEDGTISYPELVTESDVEAFFAYLASNNPALLEGVTYSFTGADEVTVDYGTSLDRETLKYLVSLFEENLISYLSILFPAPRIPAAPSFRSVDTKLSVVLSGTIGYAGYELGYSLTPIYGDITYPSVVYPSDVEAFFAYLASEEPALLEGVKYSMPAEGTVHIEYGVELTKEELTGLVTLFRTYLEKYLGQMFVPSAPVFKDVKVEVIKRVPSTPVFSVVKMTEIARIPAKPVLTVTVKNIAPVPSVLSATTVQNLDSSEDSKKKITY